LNEQWVSEEVRGENFFLNYQKKIGKQNFPEPLSYRESISKREVNNFECRL
jgi:hypothetical protein